MEGDRPGLLTSALVWLKYDIFKENPVRWGHATYQIHEGYLKKKKKAVPVWTAVIGSFLLPMFSSYSFILTILLQFVIFLIIYAVFDFLYLIFYLWMYGREPAVILEIEDSFM